MKVGLLGGSFDPPHNAHLAVATAVREARGLDRVDLLVSRKSPHRSGKENYAGVKHRLQMARIAVEGVEGVGVEDCETKREGRSYTIDTIRHLHAERPGDLFYFIIGGDMLANLPSWKEIGDLLNLTEFIPVFRPGHTEEVFDQLKETLGEEVAQKLKSNIVEMPLMDISSTSIREAAGAGESIQAWVPPGVATYIRAHHLYVRVE